MWLKFFCLRSVKVLIWIRVSSKGQLDNNSLEQQSKEILEKYEGSKIIQEQYTGTTTNRPKFEELINNLKENDTLVVTKLDRLARNTKEGIEIVEKLFEKGVSVHVLNVGLLENTTMGRFFLTTLLAVAEMERNMIVERTQAGKEIAKTKEGYREGRKPVYSEKQLKHASEMKLSGNSYKQVEELTGITKMTLYRYMKKTTLLENNSN